MAQSFKLSYINADGRVREWTLSMESFWLLLVLALVGASIAFGPLYWFKPAADEFPVVQKEPPDRIVPLIVRDPSALVMAPQYWLQPPKTLAKRSHD